MMTNCDGNNRRDDEPPALDRVAAFVTRHTGAERELLVLQQANGIRQLPVERVNTGEMPSSAALRCVGALVEANPTHIRRIAVVRERLPDSMRVILKPSLLSSAPGYTALPLRFRMERGMRVEIVEWQGEFARVCFEEYRYDSANLKIMTHRSGWLAADAFASQTMHHLFHVPIESGALIAPAEWVPLSQAEGLRCLHQRWLAQALPQLML